MTVDTVRVQSNDIIIMKASNHHGTYTLSQHEDSSITLRQNDRLIDGNVVIRPR